MLCNTFLLDKAIEEKVLIFIGCCQKLAYPAQWIELSSTSDNMTFSNFLQYQSVKCSLLDFAINIFKATTESKSFILCDLTVTNIFVYFM